MRFCFVGMGVRVPTESLCRRNGSVLTEILCRRIGSALTKILSRRIGSVLTEILCCRYGNVLSVLSFQFRKSGNVLNEVPLRVDGSSCTY